MRTSPTFHRFNDLTITRANVEYQIHTSRTDGEATPTEIFQAARDRNVSAIAFTEHVRADSAWFPDFVAEVERVSRMFPDVRVSIGCEAKALDYEGTLDASEDTIQLSDIVLGSVHRFPNGKGGYIPFASLSADELAHKECALSVGLLRAAPIDVLAHPGGMYQRRFGPYPERLLREIMEVSLERGVAVEINSSYVEDLTSLLNLCSQINPYVSIGSDVHSLKDLGRCRDSLMPLSMGAE